MRKITLILCAVLMTALSATASNHFGFRTAISTDVNDTLRVSPAYVNTYCPMSVTANFDGYLDHWFIQMINSSEMPIRDIARGSDMSVPYLNSNGISSVYQAVLTTDFVNVPVDNSTILITSSFASTINVFGYWDPDHDGHYDTYGTVKWTSGYHDDMFDFLLKIPADCVMDSITLICTLTSTTDWRGVPTVSDYYTETIYIHVAYQLGDANGDGWVNIDDVSTLTNYLLGLQNLDQYQLAAADVDGDGVVTVDDVTALIDLLMLS